MPTASAMPIAPARVLDDATVPVDLRSDTVTHPTDEMFDLMRTTALGDDGLDFDPTVRALEGRLAERLAKDDGLFVPSCTMANLLAVLAQSDRSQQVVLESNAHMYTSERVGFQHHLLRTVALGQHG